MEVLLLQDIPGVGKKNDLLVVGDGYALNNLLPRRMALVATPTVRKRYSDQIRKRAEERQNEAKAQQGVAKALQGKEIVFKRKATKTGKLYAAITEKNLVEELKTQLSLEVEEDAIEIAEPIKALGLFQVSVSMGGVNQPVTVKVAEEK